MLIRRRLARLVFHLVLRFRLTRSLTQCSSQRKFPHTLGVSKLYRLLGRQVAHFRLKARLTQEELAEKTDYSVDFIGLVERGVNAPTVARLEDIARTVGVEVWQLFYPGREENPSAPTLTKSRTKGRNPQRKSGEGAR
jgi:DNA-binding XRE family transcriptional regulator